MGHWALGIGQAGSVGGVGGVGGCGRNLSPHTPHTPHTPPSFHLPYSLLKCLRINEQTSVGSMMSLSTK